MRGVVKAALQTSLHRYASLLHFSLSTAHRMLKHDLDYHPYNLHIVQESNKPILPDGKIFANSFRICNYRKTRNFFLVTMHTLNGMSV